MSNCRFCREDGPPVWDNAFRMWLHPPSPDEPWNEGYPVPCSEVRQDGPVKADDTAGADIRGVVDRRSTADVGSENAQRDSGAGGGDDAAEAVRD